MEICPGIFEQQLVKVLVGWVGEPYEFGGQGTWNEDLGIDCSGLFVEGLYALGFNIIDQYAGDEELGTITGLIANVFQRDSPDPDGPQLAAYFERDTLWDEISPDHKWLHCAVIIGENVGVVHSSSGRSGVSNGVTAIDMDTYFGSVPANRAIEKKYVSLKGIFSIIS